MLTFTVYAELDGHPEINANSNEISVTIKEIFAIQAATLVSKYFSMDEDSPIYTFNKFNNINERDLVYQIIDSDTGEIMVGGLEIEPKR